MHLNQYSRYTMRKKMRSIRKVASEPATLSDRIRLNVNVHLNLGEPQNLVDGLPDMRFSVGSLQSEDQTTYPVSHASRSLAAVTVAGGGIQTTIRLSGPSAFTFMSVVKEIHIRKANTTP